MFCRGIQTRAIVVFENLRKTVDVTQRCSKVVGYGVGKRLQFLVTGFKLLGTLRDTLLKVSVESPDFLLCPLALSDLIFQLPVCCFCFPLPVIRD